MDLGVRNVVLPTKGKPSAARRVVEQRPAFQRLVKWRTGSEGRISCLKRDFGWNRSQIDGLQGARIWCGHGVFNHKLVKIAALVDAEQAEAFSIRGRRSSTCTVVSSKRARSTHNGCVGPSASRLIGLIRPCLRLPGMDPRRFPS